MKLKLVSSLVGILLLSACTTNGVYDAKKTWALIGTVAVGSYLLSESGSSSGDSTPACKPYIYCDANLVCHERCQ